MIYGKVASFWLLFSWLMLFPEPGVPVRTERQPTDAEILAAFPQGAIEIAPNAGVDAVLAHHKAGHHHPHEQRQLAEQHARKQECANDSGEQERALCLRQRQHHPARHKTAPAAESLAQQQPAFPAASEPPIPYGDAPPAAESPARENRSGFLQPKASTRVGHPESGSAPSLLASNDDASHAGAHHNAGGWGGGWSHLHETHHDQSTLTQSSEHPTQSDSETTPSQTVHHTDVTGTEVASASVGQQPAKEADQHQHPTGIDQFENSSQGQEPSLTSTIENHHETVSTQTIADDSKSAIAVATSASNSDTLLTASSDNRHDVLQSEGIRSEGHGSTSSTSHAHQQSDGARLLASASETINMAAASQSHPQSQQSADTHAITEVSGEEGSEPGLVTAALDDTSLAVEESMVLPGLMNMRPAFFAASLLSASESEQSSAAEATPVTDAPLAYAVSSGSQGYVLDQLTEGADYEIRLQGAGSGSLQTVTLSGQLTDSELALQGVAVGGSGWQCQHDAITFVCTTANAEDGEQPIRLHFSAPATMGHHSLQLTVTTTTDTTQESREHTRTLAFGQASDTLQQQLALAEESGATSFTLPAGLYVGTLYNRPAYPLTLIGSAQNELWLQGDSRTPLLSADALEQVRLHAAGAIAVNSAIRHSELHLQQGEATLSAPVVTANKLYLEGTGFAVLAADSDIRLENNLLQAEAAAAQLTTPAPLFAAATGHKPYRQLLGNTLVNITALADDAALADWQVANNLLLTEVARDGFTLLGGDLQGVSISHNLLPTACQWLEGENLYSDTPGVTAATGYTPASDSPALDAGDAGMSSELTDLHANSRLVGAGVDIGAVERQDRE